MFEVEAGHIRSLGDADFRELVVQLCQAELRHFGQPLSALTAGGHQDRRDGGIDVRIDLSTSAPNLDFIKKPKTTFQVKLSNYGPADIKKEMRPKGALRPAISDLAAHSGAYIIVSAKTSLTDEDLRNSRIKAMEEAAENPALVVDFYDDKRLAIWVNQYPGAALWVRDKIGHPLLNWQSWRNWSFPREEEREPFLEDKEARVSDGHNPADGELSTLDGIERMRAILSNPGGIIRLVGLSGTGKTRLVQALFESGVGTTPLNPALAVYTDLQSPEPSPHSMIARLSQTGHPAVMVIDNCPPETHKILADLIGPTKGKLSLITIEYDVRDDTPEGTEVFRLDTASAEVIELLLARRHPRLSQTDRRRIVELADNNSRLALAMADAAPKRKSLDHLGDADLFDRIFRQRNPHDTELLRAAEACSLVYSFDVETTGGDGDELTVLADLAGLSRRLIHRHVVSLFDRQLVQKRGRWRAILPHVLANHLARQALAKIPTADILSIFAAPGRNHLLKSFSRRLGYLHDSEAARDVVAAWLAPSGWLHRLDADHDDRWTILANVAPAAPDLILATIERSLDGPDGDKLLARYFHHRSTIIRLLGAIARDGSQFRRCTLALARMMSAEPEGNNHDSARSAFGALFQIQWSGTHAPQHHRLSVLAELDRPTALRGLEAMLRCQDFHHPHGFGFGSHKHDVGWWPSGDDDIRSWFAIVIDRVEELTATDPTEMRRLMARNFRQLWMVGRGVSELAEQSIIRLAGNEFWPEGWIAVRSAIRSVGDRRDTASLKHLEERLHPRDLEERVLAYVATPAHGTLDIADGESDRVKCYEKAMEIATALGEEIASSPDLLACLLPALLDRKAGRAFGFGRGLGSAVTAPMATWNQMVAVLAVMPPQDQNPSLFGGFLCGLLPRDRALAGTFLDQAITTPALGSLFPYLQNCVGLDTIGIERLIRSTGVGLAEARHFECLLITDDLQPRDITRLLVAIADMPGRGRHTAIDNLALYLHDKPRPIDPSIAACGRHLLSSFTITKPLGHMDDYDLAVVAEACLTGEEGAVAAAPLCRSLVEACTEYHINTHDYPTLIKALLKTQPLTTLDAFLLTETKYGERLLLSHFDEATPLADIPTEVLLGWAGADRLRRFPILAGVVRPLTADGTPAPVILELIERAPDRATILKAIQCNLPPSGGWTGERSEILERHAKGLEILAAHPDPIVATWARDAITGLLAEAENWRRVARQRDESFE